MKRIIFYLGIMVLTVSCKTKETEVELQKLTTIENYKFDNSIKTDIEKQKLNGSVKSLKEYNIGLNSNQPILQKSYFFNKTGNYSERRLHEDNKSYLYKYDETNRLKELLRIKDGNDTIKVYSYEYNLKGLLDTLILHQDTTINNLEYDSGGNLTQKMSVFFNGQYKESEISKYVNNTQETLLYMSILGKKSSYKSIKTIYSESNEVLRIEYNHTGSKRIDDYEYDKFGNQIRKTHYDFDLGGRLAEWNYKYDTFNNPIEITTGNIRFGNPEIRKFAYTYDEQNNILTKSESLDGKLLRKKKYLIEYFD